MEKLKAFGYCRVSSYQQAANVRDGYKRQAEAIKAYAKKHNVEIVEIFKEDISGTRDETERPVFQQMVSTILANGVRMIIVESLDRLARSVSIQDQLLIYLASKNIDLINAQTELNVTQDYQADPMRRAMVQMQGIFAELDKNQIVLRLRLARERKKARGEKGDGRYGYRDTREGRITVRRVQALLRKPKHGRRRTLRQVAEILNAEGVPTLGNKPWTPQHVQQIVRKPKPHRTIKT